MQIGVNELTKYLAALEKVKRDHGKHIFQEHQLHCETGVWLDSAVLKLQKSNWSEHGFTQGIFFSVWLGEKELKQDRFNYNIHALKLGLQKSCGAKPVAFAKAFRKRFDPVGWPNVSIDHGPQTLMDGWVRLRLDTFENDASNLVERFVAMHRIIDELLGEAGGM